MSATNNRHHPWFEDLADFEGVLECGNSGLPAWDSAATVRAFQTFHWDACPVMDGGQSFFHVATGVVVRFEGGLVAIELGEGELPEALTDLVRVLQSLGWTEATLHSSPQSLDALLKDIGAAIPAGLDFDVRVGERPVIGHSPEELRLIQHVRSLTASDPSHDQSNIHGATAVSTTQQSDEHAQLMATFASLGGGNAAPSSPGIALLEDDEEIGIPSSQVRAVAPLTLDEEIPVSAGTGDVVDFGMGVAVRIAATRPATTGEEIARDDEESIVAVPSRESGGDESLVVVAHEATTTLGASGKTFKPAVAVASSAPAPNATVDDRYGESAATPQPAMAARSSSTLHEATTDDSCIVLGNSILAFSLPGLEISRDVVTSRAEAAGISVDEVIEVRPGALEQPLRWNVLAEIDQADPLSAETIARLFDSPDAIKGRISLLPALLLAVVSGKFDEPIRELVTLACEGSASCEAIVAKNVNAALPLFRSAVAQTGLQADIQNVLCRLSSIALMPAGKSFLDTFGLPSNCEAFTIRGLAQESSSRAILIRVDELDGGLAMWLAESMASLAQRHAIANRYRPPAPPARPAPAVDREKIEQIGAGVAAILGQLKALGLEVES